MLGDSASGWVEFYRRQAAIATGEEEARPLPPEIAKQGLRASQEYYLPGQRAWEQQRKQHDKIERVNTIDMSGAITMRAPSANWSGYVSGPNGRSQQYTADGDALIHNVAVVHIEGLKRAGCLVAEGENVG